MISRLRSAYGQLLEFAGSMDALAGLSLPTISLIAQLRRSKLTYLSTRRLANLARLCQTLEMTGVPGAFLEAGCALGGSSILIARMKARERPFRIYDVFGMIPAPGSDDPDDVHARYAVIASGQSTGIAGDTYYGYEVDLMRKVRGNLRHFGIPLEDSSVQLIQGLVQDTLLIEGPVAFAHIDVDWHDPVRVCLERIYPRLSPGGVMVLDDYHCWGGCKLAADRFLADYAGSYRVDDLAGHRLIIRL